MLFSSKNFIENRVYGFTSGAIEYTVVRVATESFWLLRFSQWRKKESLAGVLGWRAGV